MLISHQDAWDLQIALFDRALRIIGPKRVAYSGRNGPYGNFHGSAAFTGVPAWKGALVRLGDKLSRLRSLAETGQADTGTGESLLDTAADALNYTCITLGLVLEAMPESLAAPLLRRLRAEARRAPLGRVYTLSRDLGTRVPRQARGR
jgi:hypothetical protein